MRLEQQVRAVELAERALIIAEGADLFEGLAEALALKGTALASIGRRVEGIGLTKIAGEVAEGHGFPLIALRALGNRGAYLVHDPRAALEVEQTYIEWVGGHRPSLMFNRRPALWMNPRQEFEEARHHLRQNFRNALATGVFQEEGGSVFFHGLRRMLDRGGIAPASIRFFQVNLPAKHIVESVLEECAAIGIRRAALGMPSRAG